MTALAALIPVLPTVLRSLLVLAALIGLGASAGKRLMPSLPAAWRTFFGLLAVVAIFIILGSGTYYLYELNRPSLSLIILATGFVALLIPAPPLKASLIPDEHTDKRRPRKTLFAAVGLVLTVLYISLAHYAFIILRYAATDASIRSPWDVVPRMYFVIFFLLAFGAFALALGGVRPALHLPVTAAIALLLTGVAAAVYAVGYGFDPFIHQATEKVIVATGAIHPKPFYYIGQYVLVAGLTLLTGAPLQQIDTWLAPIASTLIAACAFWSLRSTFGLRRESALAAALAAYLWPVSSFIVTTPQGFSNVLTIITALLALPAAAESFPRVIVALLALATAAVHPLAGVPMIIFAALLFFLTTYERTSGAHELGRKLVFAEIILMGSVALPAIFVVNSWISNAGVTLNAELLRAPTVIIEELAGPAPVLRRFMAAYDFAYSWKNTQYLTLFLLAAAGLWLARKRDRISAVFAWGAGMFLANYLLLKAFIRFPFLISYERSNYADRILDLTLFLLMPVGLYAVAVAVEKIRTGFPLLKIGAGMLLAALLTSSLYLAYPRRDKYESSHGWSTSATDAKAVRLIAEDAGAVSYAVLANQSVSAAAIREFGFSTYYASRDPLRPGYFFYYPVPTGDELYKDFDHMNETGGARQAALHAMDLTGVGIIYYVVNDYWYQAQKIVASAKRNADRTWSVDNKSWVFKYVRHQNE
jgi:hypothetical protein